MVRTRSVAVNTSDVALATEPECLGPCEPGTSVNLEGIVWQETEDGKWSGFLKKNYFVNLFFHLATYVCDRFCFYLQSHCVALRHQRAFGFSGI